MIPLPEALRFGPDGLLPAIVQDATDGTVLTLAYMNEESLEMTRRSGYTHFWSRYGSGYSLDTTNLKSDRSTRVRFLVVPMVKPSMNASSAS